MTIQIGWEVVDKEFQITNRSFECAAWHETIKVPAGKYPLNASGFTFNERLRKYEDSIKYNGVSAKLTGEIVGSDFTSHFGGVRYGSKIDQNVGQESQYYLNPYAYSVAAGILKGGDHDYQKDYRYELLSEFEAREVKFISSIDNKEITTHGIFKKKRPNMKGGAVYWSDEFKTWCLFLMDEEGNQESETEYFHYKKDAIEEVKKYKTKHENFLTL
jgi:hypothetical protein